MSKKVDEDAKRSEIRAAHRRGESPSAAGVTTGASKQREHVRDGDDRHEHSKAEGKGKS